MSLIDNMRRIMAERGVNQSELARRLNIKSQAVNQWFRDGGTAPQGRRVGEIAAALGVTLGELLGVEATPAAQLPVRGADPILLIEELDVRAMGGDGALDPDMDGNGHHVVLAEWHIPADYLRSHAPNPSAVKIIRVVGDSMEPEYPAGDRVLVDTSHRVPSPPGVYVVWDGFALLLKRVEVLMGTEPRTARLSSANPAYPPYERPVSELAIQGRVMGKWVWK